MRDRKRIAVFSPNPKSLYTTSVCELLLRNDIIIEDVFVKKFTISRFQKEFSRDGFRLIKKIWNKLILQEKAYNGFTHVENIISFREKEKIKLNNVKELKKKGIGVHFVNDLNDISVEKILRAKKVDAVVFTGGGLIRENIIKNAGAGVFNCHMGKLPEYRGMDVVEWPLFKKDFNNLGFTVHFMDKGVDTGDILEVVSVEIHKEDDSIKTLRARFEPLMTKNYVKTITAFLNGEIEPKKQLLDDGKQYYIIDEYMKEIADQNLKSYR
ncbi:formyltransferase family protein [Lacinutrix neustonica]|uniref:phosphoribosylglycinamide formyltransferase 1 n=1 Tax=Lacinutrix neustonica TaxID=2980107 RepID=A0A9E8SCW1_9FLAO|nr:formyltransferase family protein [Lacinutrix neustonica]WAC01082.1 formyltransferase family protein [Lacinutrix neustonica]